MVEIRPETEGLIDEVFVREGEWLDVGDPVASLVTHIQERNLYASEARLAETLARRSALLAGTRPEEIHRAQTIVSTAEAKLVWSTARAKRYTELYEQEIVGQQEYENAVQLQRVNARELEEARAYLELVEAGARPETLEAAEAEVESLEAIVDHYRGDLERTVLYSPIAGQITTPRVELIRGRYLKPGQRDLVATIEDTRTIVAEVLVPEEDIDGVEVGNEVTLITWSYPDRAFKGQVREIAPQATTDELKRRKVIRVLTEIPNPHGELKAEMTGQAKIETTTRPVYDVLFRPLWRWIRIEVWSWIP
jgi:putative peptide zinc metalloprotease protein